MGTVIFPHQTPHQFEEVEDASGTRMTCVICGITGVKKTLTTIEIDDGFTNEQIYNCENS